MIRSKIWKQMRRWNINCPHFHLKSLLWLKIMFTLFSISTFRLSTPTQPRNHKFHISVGYILVFKALTDAYFRSLLWVGPALLFSTATAISILGWDGKVRTILSTSVPYAGNFLLHAWISQYLSDLFCGFCFLN